jgi:hypothetical protein
MTTYDPCPECGGTIIVEDGWPRRCADCGQVVTGWNENTGAITDTITARQAAESQAEYERQMFSAEMNELYGRGNHPF